MHNFPHSIKTKLTFLVTIVITLISLFVFLYLPQKFEKVQQQALGTKINTLVGKASYRVGGAILFEDLEATREKKRGSTFTIVFNNTKLKQQTNVSNKKEENELLVSLSYSTIFICMALTKCYANILVDFLYLCVSKIVK